MKLFFSDPSKTNYQPEWFHLDEKQPEKPGYYLVCEWNYRANEIMVCRRKWNGKRFFNGHFHHRIYAWAYCLNIQPIEPKEKF